MNHSLYQILLTQKNIQVRQAGNFQHTKTGCSCFHQELCPILPPSSVRANTTMHPPPLPSTDLCSPDYTFLGATNFSTNLGTFQVRPLTEVFWVTLSTLNLEHMGVVSQSDCGTVMNGKAIVNHLLVIHPALREPKKRWKLQFWALNRIVTTQSSH